MNVYLDFESFYDTKQKYDLKSLSMVEYIRDPRFAVQGAAIAIDNGPVEWLSAKNVHVLTDYNCIMWDKATLIGHNAKFDALILKERFGIVPKQLVCTKAMAKAVLGKTVKGFSLRELAEHYGLEAKGQLKTDGLKDLTPEQEKELAEYCIHDVELCRQIFNKLKPEFPENQYPVMDWTIRTFVTPQLQLNVGLLEKASEEERERRQSIFDRIGIPKTTFSSNQQFAALLQSNGYDVPHKSSPRTGKSIPALALGDPEFLEMAESTENQRLFDFCQARIAAKSTLLETRSAKLARIGRTGAWPFDVEFSGATQTHRFSGGSGAGGNPQNFTRGSVLRQAVEAPKGHKLVIGDFSNIEMRLVAYLSKDPGLIQAVEQGRDIYCDMASAYFGRTITKQDVAERMLGKIMILALGYGMGPAKFAKTVRLQTGDKISQIDAERAVALYRAKHNRVPALWEKLQSQLPETAKVGFIELPSGLKIRFPNLRKEGKEWVYDVWKKKTEKECVKLYGGKVLENICQALAGELTKEALLKVKDWCVGQIHDELVLCVPTGVAQAAAARLKVAMTTPPSWLPELKLKAEIIIGNNWGVK